jgi:beta-glucosidase
VQKNTIVIVQNGGAVLLNRAAQSGALLETWLGGEACGLSLCDVLTGKVIPSGKLAETIPKRLEDTPAYLNFPGDGQKVVYGEDIYVGYRYYDQKQLPVLYPFGYGLSYAEFEYCGFDITVDKQKQRLYFDVAVYNHAHFPAKETVQIYVGLPESTVARPPKTLVAFCKSEIQPECIQHIRFSIPCERLAFFDVKRDQWRIESGQYRFYCGASSRDIKFEKTCEISFKEAEPVVTLDSTVDEILKTQRGSELFQMALEAYRHLTGVQIDTQDNFIKYSVLATPLSKVPMLSEGMITDRMLKRIIRYINHDVKHLNMGWLVLRECQLINIIQNLLKAQFQYHKNQQLPYSADTPIDLLLASPSCRAVLASRLGENGEEILSSKYVKIFAKTHLTLRQIQKITPLNLFKKSELETLNKRIKTIQDEITYD